MFVLPSPYCCRDVVRLCAPTAGEVNVKALFEPRPCTIVGCLRPYRARGYCHLHYRRWMAKGDPGPVETIPTGGYRPGAGEKPGPANHHWHGDAATLNAKRGRARRLYTLGVCQRCQKKPATDRHHDDGDPGNNSPENIKVLCRRCHMVEDGRLDHLIAAGKNGRQPRPARPCVVCARLSKPLRRGRCSACNQYWRVHGMERPAS